MKAVGRHCCRNSCTQFLILTCVLIPSISALLALIFGGVIAGYEDWTFSVGFEFALSAILRMTTPMVSVPLKTADGQVIECYLAIVGLALFGFIMNAINSFKLGEKLAKTCSACLVKCVKGHDKKLLLESAVFLLIVFPIVVAFGALVTGDVMATLEGWTLWEGVLWVFGNTLNASPLASTRNYEMTTLGSKVFGVYAHILNLIFCALALDYVLNLRADHHMLGTANTDDDAAVGLKKDGAKEVSNAYAAKAEGEDTEKVEKHLNSPSPKTSALKLAPLDV